jgi:hypothetical protein
MKMFTHDNGLIGRGRGMSEDTQFTTRTNKSHDISHL